MHASRIANLNLCVCVFSLRPSTWPQKHVSDRVKFALWITLKICFLSDAYHWFSVYNAFDNAFLLPFFLLFLPQATSQSPFIDQVQKLQWKLLFRIFFFLFSFIWFIVLVQLRFDICCVYVRSSLCVFPIKSTKEFDLMKCIFTLFFLAAVLFELLEAVTNYFLLLLMFFWKKSIIHNFF